MAVINETKTVLRAPVLILFAGANLANGADSVSYQTYKYVEDGSRMEVFAADIAVEKDFGTDHALSLDIGHDAISGATPCWQPKDGYANEYRTGLCTVADEVRNSLGLAWTLRDTQRNEYHFGISTSQEPDFVSNELSAQGMWWQSDTHNRAYTFGVSIQDNTAVATAHTNNKQDKGSKAYNLQAGVNQVLNRSSTLELSVFAAQDEGYLSNHYLKIVRTNAFGLHYLADDSRPEKRTASGLSARWINAWREDLVSNVWLRQYKDDWGVTGSTLETKLFWDINARLRLSPVVRLAKQGAADFYRSYDAAVNTFAAGGFGANDERLGDFTATTYQLNGDYKADKNWTFNAGVSHYAQDTGLTANWLTLGFKLSY